MAGSNSVIKDGPFNERMEVIAAYFHIVTKNIAEADTIVKANSIFNNIPNTIKIYPMMAVKQVR